MLEGRPRTPLQNFDLTFATDAEENIGF
jgi:hypothetical protein